MAPENPSNVVDASCISKWFHGVNGTLPLRSFLLALVLVKSKPFSCSVEGKLLKLGSSTDEADHDAEFLQSLLPYIKTGVRAESLDNSYGHVDIGAFWRQKFEESEAAQILLRAKLAQLRQESAESLRGSTVLVSTAASDLRRKRRQSIGGYPDRQAKKARRGSGRDEQGHRRARVDQSDAARDHGNMSCSVDVMNNITNTHTVTSDFIGDACLYNILDIERLRALPNSTAEDAYSKMGLLGYSIRRLIRAATPTEQIPTTDQRLSLEKLADVIAWYPRLLNLPDIIIADATLRSAAVYSISLVLKTLLSAMMDAARAQMAGAKGSQTSVYTTPKRKFHRLRAYADRKTLPFADAAAELCNMLLSVLEALEPEKKGHHEILEGFLTVFLNNIGTSLRWATWGNEVENGNVSNQSSQRSTADETSELFMVPHIPYLICLLERLLEKMRRITSPTCSGDGEGIGTTSAFRCPPQGLSKDVWQRLQNTLMKAVFGEAAAGDFEPSLNPSRRPKEHPPPMRTSDCTDSKAFLKREIWRLLGWDILHKSIARQ